MLSLCTAAIKAESKAMFQDLNAIAEALIKYRRAISQKQFDLIAPKMRDVVKLIENEKSNMRTDSTLIKDLKELVGDAPPPKFATPKSDKTTTTPAQSSKSPRGSNNKTNDRIEKDDFVVVNKVWKLEPNKLTEHQREKMKTRRCDIPAMYNDLSQSQDSCSIQEWTPTALATKSQPQAQSKSNNNGDKTPPITTRSNTESNESPTSSQRGGGSGGGGKKSAKVSPKRSAQNQSQSQQNQPAAQTTGQNESNERKSDNESELPEDDTQNTKRRLTRELNRIHINAKHDEVPYSNLSESNRLTRSLAKNKPLDTSTSGSGGASSSSSQQERRKTRSEIAKAVDPKDVKRKVTRASIANSPIQSKQKNKMNANRSLSNASEKEAGGGGGGGSGNGEPTPKRRLTRQSKAEESDADDSIDDKKVEIKKLELKKTEFVDTLELKVEKLANDIMNRIEPKENSIDAKPVEIESQTVAAEQQEADKEIQAQVETKDEPAQKPAENVDESMKMDVDEHADDVEPAPAAVNDEPIADTTQPTANVEENPEANKEMPAEPKEVPVVVTTASIVEPALDLEAKVQSDKEPEPETKPNDGEKTEQNAQILVETATVPNGDEPMDEDQLANNSEQPEQPVKQQDVKDDQLENGNENDIASRSYMEALVFDGTSPTKSLNGSTLITSPEIDAPRSIEFLNDTLNISPIASGERQNEKPTVAAPVDKANDKKSMATNLSGIQRLDNSVANDKQEPDTDKAEKTVTATTNENEITTELKKDQITIENEIVEMGNGKSILPVVASTTVGVTVPVPESPVVSTSRHLKISLPMQSSTPLQSHQSPVSSKFKPQFTGRGAQLLKMINSNRSPKPASPTPAVMDEHTFKTASPTINQLETAPICENVINTPEPKSTAKDKHAQEKQPKPNENGNFLTLSGALPSPYESPGISILKRKSSHFSLDDSMHSPAPKRQKRVSFGFPLSQTKEYIIDDEFTPFYMLPSSDSPSRRTNRMKKLKFKRNKYHSDSSSSSSSKVLHDNNKSNESRVGSSSSSGGGSTSSSHGRAHSKNDGVSVKQIQDYLGMDMDAYKAKQQEEKKLAAKAAAAADEDEDDEDDEDEEEEDEDDESETDDENGAISNVNEHDSNSDDSSTESNDDDPENETPGAATQSNHSIKALSDDAIMAHLLSKYSATEMLQKFDTVFDSKVLTKRLSNLMTADKHVESAVLEDLAEKHSESFLEHAITENLCSVICDQLTMKSPNGINDYIADKVNADDQFASDFLDRVSVSVLRQKLMDIVTSSKREQQILLCDFLTALKDAMYHASPRIVDTNILPEHIHLWVAKLFDHFKLTPEQYLQLTRIYIEKNPPATLDHLE